MSAAATVDEAATRRFRQAAFVYLHIAILYECTVFVLWRRGLLPAGRGPGPVWLLIGAGITALVFWALWQRKRWVARVIWALHALRLPAIIQGAFFPAAASVLPPSLWLTALPLVLLNLWMLARAGWDL